MNPGLIGTYWLLASVLTAAAFHLAKRTIRRAAHHATARCYCGTCQR